MNPLFDIRRPWPILIVIGLHIAFFYALQAGLLTRIAQTPAVREVLAQLLAPEPPPPPPPVPKIEPPRIKPVLKPVVQPTPPPPVPPYVAPVLNTPSETAISLPPPPPPPPEPQKFVPAAVVAPPPPEPVPAPPEPVIPPRFDAAYLNNPAPKYPPLARRSGEQGTVILRVRVGTQGQPQEVQLKTSSGSTMLDEAALEAVREWRFVPAKQGDQPVVAWVLVPIIYKLGR